MSIPALDGEGVLPIGVHDCTIDQVRSAFRGFGRRGRLFDQLEEYITDICRSGKVRSVVVDGSFVTDKAEPHDVDIVVVLDPDVEWPSSDSLPPYYTTRLERLFVNRKYQDQIDLHVAHEGSEEEADWLDYFSEVKGKDGQLKGILRVTP